MQLLVDSASNSYFEGDIFNVLPQVESSTAMAPPAIPGGGGPVAQPSAPASGIIPFSEWLRANMPEIYARVLMTMPEAFTPEFALAGLRRRGLMGLGQDSGWTVAPASVIQDVSSSDIPEPVTDWGVKLLNTALDAAKQILPSVAQYQGQRDIIQLNIARAEKGLGPISSADLAPTVNVGISPQIQTLGFVAVGGLVLVGLLSMLGKRRAP